jgi:hypothetical protein
MPMQSNDLEVIKAALWEQAFLGCSKVRCPLGHLQALIRGWGRWCEVSDITIERPVLCPTGGCDLEDGTGWTSEALL